MKRNGFTLVELLVVIAIISLLAAILLPVLGEARAMGGQAQCRKNLGQLGVGMALYAADKGGRLPGADFYSGHFNSRKDWPQNYDSRHFFTDECIGGGAKVFRCPAAPAKRPPNDPYRHYEHQISYVFNARLTKTAYADRPSNVTRSSAWDKHARTGLLIETEVVYDLARGPENTSAAKNKLTERHSGKGNVLFLDGHVDSFDRETWNKRCGGILFGH